MKAETPNQVNELLIEYLTNLDVDSALELYEEDASFVTADGTVTGKATIREVLEGFTALKPKFTIWPKEVVQNVDIALTGNHWSLVGTDGDGQSVALSRSSYEVVRLGADGNWRFVIDNPDVE